MKKPIRSNQKLWENIKSKILNKNVMGTESGEWSARKAQLAVKEYKEKGGKYEGKKSDENPLVKWTKQEWTTKSGKPSSETGERYLPKKAIEKLTPQQYQATSKVKKEGMKSGEQYVKQPKAIAEITKKFRK